MHGAAIKQKVLAECGRPGASLSAVALAHGLNANLVRSWVRGRGLQRAGLDAADGSGALTATPRAAQVKTALFMPVEVAANNVREAAGMQPVSKSVPAAAGPGGAAIEVDLCRGSSRMTVRWPTAQAAECAVWLRELAPALLK